MADIAAADSPPGSPPPAAPPAPAAVGAKHMKFLRRLFDVCQDTTLPDIWLDRAYDDARQANYLVICIRKDTAFETEVLPRLCPGAASAGRFATMQRQLNWYKFHLFSKTEHLSSAENQNGDGTGSEGATSKDKTTVVKYMHQHIKSVPGTEEEFVEAVGPFRTRNTRSSPSADPRSGFKREHPADESPSPYDHSAQRRRTSPPTEFTLDPQPAVSSTYPKEPSTRSYEVFIPDQWPEAVRSVFEEFNSRIKLLSMRVTVLEEERMMHRNGSAPTSMTPAPYASSMSLGHIPPYPYQYPMGYWGPGAPAAPAPYGGPGGERYPPRPHSQPNVETATSRELQSTGPVATTIGPADGTPLFNGSHRAHRTSQGSSTAASGSWHHSINSAPQGAP